MAAAGGAGDDGRGVGVVDIVTYNLLSDSLCSPKSWAFKTRDPADLDPDTRYARIEGKLEPHTTRRAIIALQEVSRKWAGKLHVFFAARRYLFIVSHYGGYFNGYMGVGVAVPMDAFELLEAETVRVSDEKRWPRPPQPSLLARAWDASIAIPVGIFKGAVAGVKAATPDVVSSAVCRVAGACRRTQAGAPWGQDTSADPWNRAKGKWNTMVFVRVRDRASGERLALGTYHMPCAFREPALMVIHAALVAQAVQKRARGDAYVLCGDFNIKPHDQGFNPCYDMLTTGKLDRSHPAYPVPPGPWETWTPELREGMQSAYAAAKGAEPLFTNYVEPEKAEDEFCDTLDYIFCSRKGLRVVDVLALPSEKSETGPLPSATEPSDHILIGATISLGGDDADERDTDAVLSTEESGSEDGGEGEASDDEEEEEGGSGVDKAAEGGTVRRRRAASPAPPAKA
uniref:Endonuclease/exonuclease/phosphatase domain-containing protein n=1 Tax=Bicosoecida sp. CB-2014 TaxID=1486930 RepID=A0A7S1G458_9STRA|mmetsp:Transcript_15193/g.52783  ORF Transcript_15193/g.52783 Transcript_15193/m.52783 type:complete len:456 (+) Transcript_15193:191-1558(+)